MFYKSLLSPSTNISSSCDLPLSTLSVLLLCDLPVQLEDHISLLDYSCLENGSILFILLSLEVPDSGSQIVAYLKDL